MSGMGGSIRTPATNRSDVVKRLIEEEHIIPTVSSSLEQYLDQVRFVQLNENLQQFDPMTQDLLHSKFSHYVHVDERLAFLRYVLQHGKVFLEDPYKLWTCLAEHPVVETDRDLCFKWFSKLMTADDDPDLKPEMIKEFYEGKILQVNFHPIVVPNGHFVQKGRLSCNSKAPPTNFTKN
jgi:ubiquitin carboxyl-terminal hydrolase 9/24